MAKTIIHVNRQRIARNKKRGTRDPALTVRHGGGRACYANEVLIHDHAGRVVARVVYRPDRPLACGAHAWVEAYYPVILGEVSHAAVQEVRQRQPLPGQPVLPRDDHGDR
jgi:hypothetical protein